jgi:integrase
MVAKHPFFPTRYYVGILPGNPLAIPTERLTMRTLRHTCVTLYFDAGVPPHLISGITGHSQDEVDEILAYYRARTADQAAAALTWRIEYEERMKAKKATSALAGAQEMSRNMREV